LNPYPELLAGRGGDAVRGDAEVVAHVEAANLGKFELAVFNDGN
jgi:hypothetical protein